MVVLLSRYCGKTGSIRQRLTRSTAVVRIENRNFFLTTTVIVSQSLARLQIKVMLMFLHFDFYVIVLLIFDCA